MICLTAKKKRKKEEKRRKKYEKGRKKTKNETIMDIDIDCINFSFLSLKDYLVI